MHERQAALTQLNTYVFYCCTYTNTYIVICYTRKHVLRILLIRSLSSMTFSSLPSHYSNQFSTLSPTLYRSIVSCSTQHAYFASSKVSNNICIRRRIRAFANVHSFVSHMRYIIVIMIELFIISRNNCIGRMKCWRLTYLVAISLFSRVKPTFSLKMKIRVLP